MDTTRREPATEQLPLATLLILFLVPGALILVGSLVLSRL
jgi:hypothetical protein